MSPAKEQFIPIRPGIVDYLTRGDISLFEFAVYFLIHAQADFSKGVWHGSAPRIKGTAPRGSELRKIQRAIERLADLGLVRTFNTQGQRGNYPVLINKFTIRSGALKGMRVNAALSASWTTPYCEPCADTDADTVTDSAPSQEVRGKRKQERENPAAKTTPLADPRHAVVFSFCFEAFRAKYGQKPTWGVKEGKKLRDFLKEHPSLPAEETCRRYKNLLDSTAHFHAEKHGSLFHLLNNFDELLDGPIFEKGGAYGKQTVSAQERIKQGDEAGANFLRNNRGMAADLRQAAIPAKPDPETVN